MNKYVNGKIVPMTDGEIAEMEAQARQFEREQFYAEATRELDDAYKLELMMRSIPVQDKPADRAGYVWKPIYRNDGSGFGWEEVADPYYIPVNDGTDYTKPITWTAGMAVVTGLWYTDGEDIWDAIKDGVPASFADREFFGII